jgi:secretion/DNA translocation related CpaE-like protein
VPASRARSRPLVASADEFLLDDLLRLVAAAGAEAQVATGGPALRRAHREAPLVLLGADALAAGEVRRLPRRAGVVVVAAEPLPAERWAAAVEVGAERVAVLPADEPWLLARVAGAVRTPVERGRLVLVGGCCGGAGTSTVAAAVALAAAPGVLLVDTDVRGGGLDLLLGAERAEGLRWPELTGLRGRVAGDALLAALPEAEGVHVLAADRTRVEVPSPEAVAAVVDAATGHGATVVVDAVRTGDAAWGSGAFPEPDLAVLVVPARLRAATAARLLVTADDSPWARASLVVRTVPGGLSPAEVTDVVGRPVLAELAHDRSAVPRGERGQPPSVAARSPLGVVARRVLAGLAAAARAA